MNTPNIMALKTFVLPIKGMSCSSCSRSVEKQMEQVDGLIDKSVNHETHSGEFTIDESKITELQLIDLINEGHYKVDLSKGSTNSTSNKIPECPTCQTSGMKVPNTVLRSNLTASIYKKTILEDDFNICMTPTCSVAYYTRQHNQLIDKAELKRELNFKNGTEREIICYCNNVDKKQILEAAIKYKITNWDKSMGFYRNKVQEKCEILNPTGLCCRDLFDEIITESKK